MAYERNRPKFLLEAAQRHGDVVRYSDRTWLVSDPDLVERLFKFTNADITKAHNFLRQPVDAADTEVWMQGRRASLPGLGRSLHRVEDQLVARAADRVTGWSDGIPIDVRGELVPITAEAISECCLGPNTKDVSDLTGALLDALFPIVSGPFRFPQWLPLPRMLAERQAERRLQSRLQEIISQRMLTGADRQATLLDELLHPKPVLETRALARFMMGLLLAGYSVPAAAMCWVCFVLARRPHVQEALRSELVDVLGSRQATVADLGRVPYLQAVIRETLRLFPPTWLLLRRTKAPLQLGPYLAPAGQFFLVSPYVMGRDPRWFSNPHAFQPERWLDDRSDSTRPTYAYIPFGAGPRVCLGRSLAVGEMMLLTATIVRLRRFQVDSQTPVTMDARRSLYPGGLRLVTAPIL